MKKYIGNVIAVFLLLSFLFVPLTISGKDGQFQLTQFLFEQPVALLQKTFFPKALPRVDFSSDTIALNLLLGLLLFLSSLLVLALSFSRLKKATFMPLSRIISAYYLAFILLKYGIDKVFKAQFYLPEPNILYTPFGQLTKDTLYWSTLGTSHYYSVAMGLVEVIVAVLILLKKTRILGLLLALGVFINIVLINFGFDISVKTFSLFLVFTTVFALFPSVKTLVGFFVFGQHKALEPYPSIVKNQILKAGLKTLIVGLLLLQIVYPYLVSGNFNDDLQKRPPLHGAYRVTQVYSLPDSLPTKELSLKNIFIHRNNYLIFQDTTDKMTDYHLERDALKEQLILEDYQKNKIRVPYEFNAKGRIFKLTFKKYLIVSEGMDWRHLPALQNKTHYTIDEIN